MAEKPEGGLTLDLKRITLGNLLSIITMISCVAVFYAKFESRVSIMETNINWIMRTTSTFTKEPLPSSAK